MSNNDKNEIIKDKSTSIVVVVAVFVAALAVVITVKAVSDFGDYREIYTNEAEVLDRYEENRSNLEALASEADQIESEEGITSSDVLPLLPSRYHPTATLAMLEQLASQSEAQISDLSVIADPDTGDVPEGLAAYRVDIGMIGGYADVKDFLRAVEVSARPLLTEEVSLTQVSDDISAQLQIMVFYQGGETFDSNSNDNADDDDITGPDDIDGGGL